MALDKIALICVLVVVGVWCSVMLTGIVATFPYGLPVLGVVAVVGYFFYRVIRDRLGNAEDDYYEKNVEK